MEALKIRVDGGKRFLQINRDSIFVSGNDGSNDGVFVDVSSTTFGVGEFEQKSHRPF